MKKFLILLGLLAGCTMTPDEVEHAQKRNRERVVGHLHQTSIDGNGVVCYVYAGTGVSCVKVK